MKLMALLIFPIVMAMTTCARADFFKLMQPKFENLISKSIDERATARIDIQKQLDNLKDDAQKKAVDDLLATMRSGDTTAKQTSAIALSKFNPPWQATNHDVAVRDLYALFQATSDP